MANSRNLEDQYIIDRIKNQPGSAEGSVLPPRFLAGQRVPVVTNFRIVKTESFSGGTAFTLAFDTPLTLKNLDKFNIFYSLGNTSYNFAGSTINSPATFRIVTDQEERVVFQIQTVLLNGFSSRSDTSPTCVGYTISGTISGSDIPDGSLGLNKLVGGAAGTIIVGQGVSSAPAYTSITSPSLNFVFGGTNLAASGRIPYVSSSATLDDDADLLFDSTNKRITTRRLTLTESTALSVVPVSANTTLNLTGTFWPCDASGGAVTLTLPADADAPIGQVYVIIATDATNNIIITPDGTDNINGLNASLTMTYTGATVRLVKTAANNWWAW